MAVDYNLARNQLTASLENSDLYNNGNTYNKFWVDSTTSGGVTSYKLNIGFGYNITSNIGSARATLLAAGVSFTDTQRTSIAAAASRAKTQLKY